MNKKAILLMSFLLLTICALSLAEDAASARDSKFGYKFNFSPNLGTNSTVYLMWGSNTDVFFNIGVDLKSLWKEQSVLGESCVGMDFNVFYFTEDGPLTVGWALPLRFNVEQDAVAIKMDALATLGFQYLIPAHRVKLYMRLGAGVGSNLAPAFDAEHPVRFVYSGNLGLLLLL